MPNDHNNIIEKTPHFLLVSVTEGAMCGRVFTVGDTITHVLRGNAVTPRKNGLHSDIPTKTGCADGNGTETPSAFGDTSARPERRQERTNKGITIMNEPKEHAKMC